MIVQNTLIAKLKGETPMTDTMMIRDCIRSQGMKLVHVAHVLKSIMTVGKNTVVANLAVP